MSPALALALEALHRITEFDEHEWAGPAKRDALATIAAIAALEAETGEPVAWAMLRADGIILDVIDPGEHALHEGQYTIPLYRCAA